MRGSTTPRIRYSPEDDVIGDAGTATSAAHEFDSANAVRANEPAAREAAYSNVSGGPAPLNRALAA
jgi:hypothetical protein